MPSSSPGSCRRSGAAGRSRRSSPSRSCARRAVRLDEALLHHHHRLGREQVVAVVAEDVERGGRDGVALAEHDVVVTPPVVRPGGTSRRCSPRRRCRSRRPFQPFGCACSSAPVRRAGCAASDLVDRAVDGAGLHPDDVGHSCRRRGGGGARFAGYGRAVRAAARNCRRRAVEVVDAGRDRAVRVERLAQGGAGHRRLKLRRFTDERLLARPGENGP